LTARRANPNRADGSHLSNLAYPSSGKSERPMSFVLFLKIVHDDE